MTDHSELLRDAKAIASDASARITEIPALLRRLIAALESRGPTAQEILGEIDRTIAAMANMSTISRIEMGERLTAAKTALVVLRDWIKGKRQ